MIPLFLGTSTFLSQSSYRSTYRVAMEKPSQPAQRAGETSTWRFQVMDRDGSVRTEILREMPFDIAAPVPAVFEDGTVALVHSFDNIVEFFGTDGGLTRRLSLSPVPNPEFERVIRHTVHDALLVLLISEPGSTSCRLIVLDARANILRERTLEGLQATGVAISPDARTIAAGVRTSGSTEAGEVWLVGQGPGNGMDGVRIESAGGGFSRGSFSADGGTFLGRTNVSVIEVDVVAKAKRWEYRSPTGRLVIDAALGTNGTSVLVADAPALEKGAWVYRRPAMRVVASDGTVVSERSVPSMGFKRATLVVKAGATEVVFDGVAY